MTEADENYAGLIRQGRFNELLEQFYRDEGENIFNLVLHTVGDYDSAQDLVQESFIKIHRYVRQLRSPEVYRFWAYRIVVNTCKSFLRQQQKDLQRLGDSHDEDMIIDETAITPPDQFHNESVRQALQQALSQLTSDYRTVLLLYYYHDYKYDEIATILSLPLNTVKSQIRRAKQQLSRSLARKKVEDAL
ncbi:MAG: RNA polymerase sigma factor [Fidelibacterota bacterium]|nr:MAG: RNA polymerase sigma factor [Candidatus Neomarinimicrobiota bacterium]